MRELSFEDRLFGRLGDLTPEEERDLQLFYGSLPMSEELFDTIEANPPVEVDLTTVRKTAVTLRDAYLEKNEIEEHLKVVNSKIYKIERQELPELFTKARISSVTVDPDGNHPGFVAKRITEYSAKIPDDRKPEAFEWFEKEGHGDLVKAIITVIFGMYEHDKRNEVIELLRVNGVEFCTSENVHPMTLKAFVKHELIAGRTIPMDLLGANMWDCVKIEKEK